MPARLWIMLSVLCAAIGAGSVFALYVGVNEVRLARSGPLRPVLAEEIRPGTRGWLQVLGCARHDLEVAINADGQVVTGERDPRDRLYVPLTPQSECEDEAHPESLHLTALVESQDAGSQGLSRLYAQGYQPPPTKVVVDGVMGFGGGDGWRESLARQALGKRAPVLSRVPLLVKGRRPGSPAVAYATAAVGFHGLLLLGVLGFLAARRALRGGVPQELLDVERELDEAEAG